MDLSIIIPTYNRSCTLRQTLESIARILSGNSLVEVIVVDNGSRDATASVFTSIQYKYPVGNWRYIYDDTPGLLTGRHSGAAVATGDTLTFLDDDVVLSSTWLEAVTDAFRDPRVVLVGGPSVPKYDCDPPSWLPSLWWEFEEGRCCGSLSLLDLGSRAISCDPCLIWGLNFSVRKQSFYRFGGFHPDTMPERLQRYQGDGETGLSLKMKREGIAGFYHPAASVTHIIPSARLTKQSLERRAFFQGVCDSYTMTRAEGRAPLADRASWIDTLRPLKRKLHRAALLRSPGANAVRTLLHRAHSLGASFHAQEVRADAELLSWILRPNYLREFLPNGWERYAGKSREAGHPPLSPLHR